MNFAFSKCFILKYCMCSLRVSLSRSLFYVYSTGFTPFTPATPQPVSNMRSSREDILSVSLTVICTESVLRLYYGYGRCKPNVEKNSCGITGYKHHLITRFMTNKNRAVLGDGIKRCEPNGYSNSTRSALCDPVTPLHRRRPRAKGPSLFPFVAHEVVAREAREALRASVEPHDGLLQMDIELVNNT